ncbi:HlyD family secretion protein [Sulfitobacter sp. G21635-S1]|uniref:HlyD family secretion protein n=1 Tax=Sulfitobacter sp. G21635-S1 TaxID=3014043 RepID=UPI0022AE8430|nr:HlyD family secretion protein [Sulfitobacter sp. G21635-S1]MCZ4255327.1 HlyD family secretion protein [Sulfitobacter sp. G21635-S1]
MKNFKLIGLAIAAVIAGGGLYWWYQNGLIYPSTDDAYLRANILTIAPQVSGRVTEVSTGENKYVRAGDLIFKLDTAQLQAAVETAQANYDQARRNAGSTSADVLGARAHVAGAQTARDEAQTSYDRQKSLFEKGDVSQAALDQASTALDQATATLQAAQSALAAARSQAGEPGDRNAVVRAALGQLTQAQIALDHATVTAPVHGWVANITLRPGQVVAAGQPLFSIVEDGHWWVDGNFKETDLMRIRPGQPVSISIDMYPDTRLNGKIESIGAGSGAVFSLLPPENATGNWVKVTQRFPVRISLEDKPGNPAVQLRVGASVTATVDTSADEAGQ